MSIFGAIASPAPGPLGVEVVRRDDGLTTVREVVSLPVRAEFD